MKKFFLLGLVLVPLFALGQTLSLDSCRAKARANYPLLKQVGLIEKTAEYNLANVNKAYLPQLSLAAKASYQSDVTEIPAVLGQILTNLSGLPVSFPGMNKDQYQAVLEVNQLVWDGGLVRAQKKTLNASTETERRKLEVDLYALNDRVNQLFFGVLLMNEQLKQLGILEKELDDHYQRVSAYYKNGVAQPADLDAVRVEQINASQRESDLKTVRKTYLQLLSAFIGEKLDESIQLLKPDLPELSANSPVTRPEISLLDAQQELFDSQKQALRAGNLPKLGLYLQGGYGRPGLNMFISDFSPFYIGGLRLSWNIGSLYTQKNNLAKIDLNKESINVQKETFLFNTELQTRQQLNELDKLRQTLKNDDEIIGLRTRIKQSAQAKLANGTLTVTDLMREVNAESMARQNRILHEIQLYQAAYQLKNTINP